MIGIVDSACVSMNKNVIRLELITMLVPPFIRFKYFYNQKHVFVQTIMLQFLLLPRNHCSEFSLSRYSTCGSRLRVPSLRRYLTNVFLIESFTNSAAARPSSSGAALWKGRLGAMNLHGDPSPTLYVGLSKE